MDIVGSSGTVQSKNKTRTWEVGVSIVLTNSGLTKVVTFTPYYMLLNTSPYTLICKENHNESPWIDIPSKQCMPVWPLQTGKDMTMQVKVKDSDICTSHFLFNKSHNTLLKLDNQYGGKDVECQETKSSVVTTLTNYKVGMTTVLIISHTEKCDISYQQRFSQNENTVLVQPPSSLDLLENSQEDVCYGETKNSENNPLEMLALAAENDRLKKQLASALLVNTDLTRKVADTEQQKKKADEENEKPVLISVIKLRANVKKDEFIYYTGLKAEQFSALFEFLSPKSQDFPFKMSRTVTSMKKLTMEDQLLLVLMKLRQNFDFFHLGNLFGMTQQDASCIFRNWIQYMFFRCGSVSIWPHRDVIIANMPESYREEFPNTLVIIDGTEIRIQRPSSLTRQSQCYSAYKSCNTLKGLVGIDPRGSIIFASMLFSGSISDKEITKQSGFLLLLEKLKECGKILEGDGVMADKGFNIDGEISSLGLKLNIPPFANSGSQMSKADIKLTEKIAKHRVHVERAIARVKNFKILSNRIDLTLFTCINQIWFVCCFLTNFMGFFIKD